MSFIFFPVTTILTSALRDNDGGYAPLLLFEKLLDDKIWGVACIHSRVSCGVAWNSLILAISVGVGTTLLGLAFALIATRRRTHRISMAWSTSIARASRSRATGWTCGSSGPTRTIFTGLRSVRRRASGS
jgi:ABC-type Fe3+ transport system permease subunit